MSAVALPAVGGAQRRDAADHVAVSAFFADAAASDVVDDNPITDAHYRQAERDIARYLENPKERAPKSAMPAWGGRPRSRYPLPPGPPLG